MKRNSLVAAISVALLLGTWGAVVHAAPPSDLTKTVEVTAASAPAIDVFAENQRSFRFALIDQGSAIDISGTQQRVTWATSPDSPSIVTALTTLVSSGTGGVLRATWSASDLNHRAGLYIYEILVTDSNSAPVTWNQGQFRIKASPIATDASTLQTKTNINWDLYTFTGTDPWAGDFAKTATNYTFSEGTSNNVDFTSGTLTIEFKTNYTAGAASGETGTLSSVLSRGNDGAGLKITNVGAPTVSGDVVTYDWATNAHALASARIAATEGTNTAQWSAINGNTTTGAAQQITIDALVVTQATQQATITQLGIVGTALTVTQAAQQVTIDANTTTNAAQEVSISARLPLAGGTMSGAIDMGGFTITNGFVTPASLSTNGQGTAAQVLTSDGGGAAYWADASGGGGAGEQTPLTNNVDLAGFHFFSTNAGDVVLYTNATLGYSKGLNATSSWEIINGSKLVQWR